MVLPLSITGKHRRIATEPERSGVIGLSYLTALVMRDSQAIDDIRWENETLATHCVMTVIIHRLIRNTKSLNGWVTTIEETIESQPPLRPPPPPPTTTAPATADGEHHNSSRISAVIIVNHTIGE